MMDGGGQLRKICRVEGWKYEGNDSPLNFKELFQPLLGNSNNIFVPVCIILHRIRWSPVPPVYSFDFFDNGQSLS